MRTHCPELRPETFVAPEQLPQSEAEARRWQDANRTFWESNPMRYDWNEAVGFQERSQPFYEEIDRRFFGSVWQYMPWDRVPFDELVDFQKLSTQHVLEIGVGMGSHAALFCAHAGSYTGIDLTCRAVEATSERLRLFELGGQVCRMDAEQMDFPDSTFDFLWSWGVIHHSANTARILREMRRVLKPGGEAVVMVYHRGWWNYYACGALLHAVESMRRAAPQSFHATLQSVTDGALARYYTRSSWRKLVQPFFTMKSVMIKGNKPEVFAFPAGKLKSALLHHVPDSFTRFLTNRCRMGSFLISRLVRR